MFWRAFSGILIRELRRFWQQKARLVSALVRPLLWLVVFAAGFRAALGIAIIPPYDTYITYDVYIMPGLAGIILLFNGMQSSLSMVYDREMGSMKVLLTSPMPRPFLLISKLIAGAFISLMQAYAFFLLAWLMDIEAPLMGYVYAMPALLLTALMLGAIGLVLSSFIKQLENFAGVMNFVVFPLFFLSSALYPLWKLKESNEWLYWIATVNPFTHGIEFVRFALYEQWNMQAMLITLATTVVFSGLAIWGYDPRRGMQTGKKGR